MGGLQKDAGSWVLGIWRGSTPGDLEAPGLQFGNALLERCQAPGAKLKHGEGDSHPFLGGWGHSVV